MLLSEVDVALDLGVHLDALGIPWLVGGSIASSLLGEPRATADVDIAADLRVPHVDPLFARIVDTYYADRDTMRWAAMTRRTFNVIQLASMIKIDIYCVNDAMSRAQLDRRIRIEVAGNTLPICTSEDIILQKLLWFEQGKRVSDRQWRDLLGVVRVNRERLDREYLDTNARELKLTELLAKLFEAAG